MSRRITDRREDYFWRRWSSDNNNSLKRKHDLFNYILRTDEQVFTYAGNCISISEEVRLEVSTEVQYLNDLKMEMALILHKNGKLIICGKLI